MVEAKAPSGRGGRAFMGSKSRGDDGDDIGVAARPDEGPAARPSSPSRARGFMGRRSDVEEDEPCPDEARPAGDRPDGDPSVAKAPPPPPPAGFPMAVDPTAWGSVPSGWRDEAKHRCAVLSFQGHHPDAALGLALDDMRAQEEDSGETVDWTVVRALADAHPQPSRDAQHRPYASIVETARVVASAADAEATEPGSIGDAESYLAEFGMTGRYLKAGVDAFHARLTRASGRDAHPLDGTAPALPAPAWIDAEWFGGDGSYRADPEDDPPS